MRNFLPLMKALALVSGGLFSSHPLIAEERFMVEGHHYAVSIALPQFAERGNPEKYYSSRQVGPGSYFTIGELIPKGESFDAWTSLYAIKIEEGVGLTLRQYVSQLATVYLDSCDLTLDIIGFEQLAKNRVRVVFPCQFYKDTPETGELAIMDIRKFNDTFIQIYQHWRGPAFSADDRSSWPKGSSAGVVQLVSHANLAIVDAH